jgi:hypothetical protein
MFQHFYCVPCEYRAINLLCPVPWGSQGEGDDDRREKKVKIHREQFPKEKKGEKYAASSRNLTREPRKSSSSGPFVRRACGAKNGVNKETQNSFVTPRGRTKWF